MALNMEFIWDFNKSDVSANVKNERTRIRRRTILAINIFASKFHKLLLAEFSRNRQKKTLARVEYKLGPAFIDLRAVKELI